MAKPKDSSSFHNALDSLFQKLSKEEIALKNQEKAQEAEKKQETPIPVEKKVSPVMKKVSVEELTPVPSPEKPAGSQEKRRYPSIENRSYLNAPSLRGTISSKNKGMGNAVVSLAEAFSQVEIGRPQAPKPPEPVKAKVVLPSAQPIPHVKSSGKKARRSEQEVSFAQIVKPAVDVSKPNKNPKPAPRPNHTPNVTVKATPPQASTPPQESGMKVKRFSSKPPRPTDSQPKIISPQKQSASSVPSVKTEKENKAPVKRFSQKRPQKKSEAPNAQNGQAAAQSTKPARKDQSKENFDRRRRQAPWLDKESPCPYNLTHPQTARKDISLERALSLKYPDLPINRYREDIIAALSEHQVVIVVGETGSGKTTQLAKMAYDAAQQGKLGRKAQLGKSRIGCTQPRRLAAVSVARRVAEEMEESLGAGVGYQVRFDERVGSDTAIKFMTDGILLAETQADPLLQEYHTLIIDEAHERSLNIDFILGFLKLLLEKRPDLKLVISSATMDVETFSGFFNDAPIIFVEGRTFPVEMHYLPEKANEELPRHIDRAVSWLSDMDQKGDVLVFLPGEREIREARDVLEGKKYPHTEILPLFARMSLGEQQKIFHPQGNKRRIILATNVAETSLTIPGIIYVVDSGIVRMSRYSPGRQVQRLMIEETSQASARQRAGRCGRVTEGVCVRLYSEEDFEDRKPFTDPEMKRSSLSSVLLRMKAIGLPEMSEFPLPDPPSQKLVSEGYRVLRELGALTRDRELTTLGYYLAKLPVDPQLARMILEAKERRCLTEILVLAAGLSIMDVRERPADKTTQADQAQRRWKNEQSDFLSLLSLWSDLLVFKEGKNWKRNALRKFCQEHYLNFLRVIEWSNLVDDLTRLVQETLRWKVLPLASEEKDRATYADLHKSILAGIPRQFGYWNPEEKEYRGAQGRSFAVFPGSSLFGRKKRPEWIMGVEIVETSRLWMRRCAEFDPAWVEEVAPHLCESRYYQAEWDVVQGAVYAKERVMCGGLVLVQDRRMHFGRLFPKEAREIFIRDGLLKEGLKTKPAFITSLEQLKETVKEAEIKWRKPEQLWCEDAVVRWFERVIPDDCYTAKAFYQWSSKLNDSFKKALEIPVEEATYALWNEFIPEDYPDQFVVNGTELSVYYEYDVLADDDGATFGAHIDQVESIPDELLSWGIPGHWALRAELLMRGLSQPHRNGLHPIVAHSEQFAQRWKSPEKQEERYEKHITFNQALLSFVSEITGLPCYEDQLEHHRIPKELIPKLWVCDDRHRELAFGSDIVAIRELLAPIQKRRFERQAASHWSATRMKTWACDDLPYSISLPSGVGYPALIDEGATVGMKIFYNEQEAQYAHRQGCIRLAHLNHVEQINHLRKRLDLSMNAKLALSVLGKSPQYNTEELISLCVEGALGKTLPRSSKAFQEAGYHLKQTLFPVSQIVCKAWEKLVALDVLLKKEIPSFKGNKFSLHIAQDLEIEREWLFRPHMLMTTGFYRMPDVLRHIEGLYTRLQKIPLQPLVKELERLDRLKLFRDPWLIAFQQAMEEASSQETYACLTPKLESLIDFGFLLEEYRLSLFSPGIPVKGKISEKKLTEAWEFLSV